MQNLAGNWRIVVLSGFLIATLWFILARRTVIRGWRSARYGGRLTRRHNPISFFWGGYGFPTFYVRRVYLQGFFALGASSLGIAFP